MNPDYFLQLGIEPAAVAWLPVPLSVEAPPWGVAVKDAQGATVAALTGSDAAAVAVLFAHAPQMLALLERIGAGRPLTVEIIAEIKALTATVRQ